MKKQVWTTVLACALASVCGCSFDTSVLSDPVEPGATDAGEVAMVDAEAVPVPDAAPEEPDAAPSSTSVEPEGDIEESDEIGGEGGGEFGPTQCPAGHFLVGFDADFYLAGDGGAGFCNVRARCSRVQHVSSGLARVGPVATLPMPSIGFCGGDTTPLQSLECAEHQVVSGLSVRTSGLYEAPTEMQLRCATISPEGDVELENFTDTWGQIIGQVDGDFTTSCEDDAVATGIGGRVGAVIDAVSLGCQGVASP